MLDGSQMLGDLKANVRALSSVFQPDLNTKFSAAILVEKGLNLRTLALDICFHLVSNPYAKVPMGENFQHLFS